MDTKWRQCNELKSSVKSRRYSERYNRFSLVSHIRFEKQVVAAEAESKSICHHWIIKFATTECHAFLYRRGCPLERLLNTMHRTVSPRSTCTEHSTRSPTERDLHFWTRTLHLTIYFQSQIAFGKWMELHSIKKNKTHTQQTKPTKYKPTLWKLFQQKPPTTLKVRRHNTKDTISIPSDYLWSSCPAGINRRVLFWWKTRNKVIETLYFNTLRADQNS